MKIHKKLKKNYIFRSTLKKLKDSQTNDDDRIDKYINFTNKRIKKRKDQLCNLFKSNQQVRVLQEEAVSIDNHKNIVSVFESSLTRILDISEGQLSREIIIVQTYFFEVLKDIILNGFFYKNEKYICFTASAGQIRTKKTVFIKEDIFHKHHLTLMCGLSIERINQLGGVNINKYLAYLALCNSATEEWIDFDINKSIVVDDMQTSINTTVDFIDHQTYKVQRKKMNIPIEHTDGCGMILPRTNNKAMMVRLPWVKGLLVPFPFDKFIREHKHLGNKVGIVKDIYGVEHDIIKEKIEVIFTKSQFKMWKYYQSWEEYKEFYIKYNCQAGKCNEEENSIGNAKLNYQMLQTLTDISNDELIELSSKTATNIMNIGSDKKTMLRVLGVTDFNQNKNYYQQALEMYPELLNDTYSKEVIKQVKKSLVRQAKAGKIDIAGKYTFLCPDLYAFCEYLFLKINSPKGLLENLEVSCNLFDNDIEVDCLRSPHLYREHAIRRNVIDKEIKRWFVTKSIYTSVHDPISKILMFDNDGDKALVCEDRTLVSVAKRNMEDIYPLYYEMAKAEAEPVNNLSIFNGLNAAYTGGNIGLISNDITKIWNSEHIDLDAIKILCMENNFTIDYAKTLYKPERPQEMKERLLKHSKDKAPEFFVYAKDKAISSVEVANNSVVNRLARIIPNPRINFKKVGIKEFNYKLLMSDPNLIVELDQSVIDAYTQLDLKKKFMIHMDDDKKNSGDLLEYHKIRTEITINSGRSVEAVTDILIEHLYNYKKSSYKTTLWSAFGDIILRNLLNNLGKLQNCELCGSPFIVEKQRQKRCTNCLKDIAQSNARKRVQKHRKNSNAEF